MRLPLSTTLAPFYHQNIRASDTKSNTLQSAKKAVKLEQNELVFAAVGQHFRNGLSHP
jgi:hypothetical protein